MTSLQEQPQEPLLEPQTVSGAQILADDADFLHELHSRSWEMELLLSAAVIFSLFQLPSLLDTFAEYVHFTIGAPSTLFFADACILTLFSASYILIANFLAHLIMRSFWIGLIGLDRAYPRGIIVERLHYAGFLRQYVSAHVGQLQRLITKVDRASSIIFSFTFLIVGLLVFFATLTTVMVTIIILFDLRGAAAYCVLLAPLMIALPMMTIVALDKFTDRFKPKWKQSERLASISERAYHLFHTATPRFFMAPILFVLTSNMKRWKFIALSWFYVLGATLSGVAGAAGYVEYKGAIFYSDAIGKYSTSAFYYDNQRPDRKYMLEPSIQSDIISDKYIRLFIPYNVRNNDSLLKHSDAAQFFAPEGVRFRLNGASVSHTAHEKEALETLKKSYAIMLNDSLLLDCEFLFYQHPKTAAKGIITYIPAALARPGRNVLSVQERFAAEAQAWYISFWQ
jgi:hypothetical protein